MSAAAEPSFTGFVDDLASRLSERSSTFDALVSAMPGVLPDEVLASLRRLPGEHAARLAADAANDRADPMIDQCASLPLPHPLDSEFRFDAPTARSLAAELVASTRDGEEILLVGVPSVAVELATMDVDRKVRFLAPDDCVTAAVARAFDDRRLLLGQGVGATAATALVDPPWYPDPMAALIRVCAAGCRSGATVVFAMPPVGTRPGIVPERAALIGIAGAAGLLPTGEVTDVRYRSPLFELAAMERMGIARLPGWRRGEAVRFVADATVPDQRWSAPGSTELTVAGVRLRLLPGEGGGGGALLPIGGHEVFPSVSARAPGRSLATLWTTTNRAFAVDRGGARNALAGLAGNPGLLHSGINRPENDHPPHPCVDTAGQLIHQLAELVGREVNDARRLVGDGAWLETEMEWRS